MIKEVSLNDIILFNELGLIINSNFDKLFILSDILSSEYDYLYGYYDNNILVGFIHISKMYEVIDIVNIVVNKDYRKRGIATLLINYVIEKFDDVESILLEVNEHNSDAISLYLNNKFYEVNRRLCYYGNDAAIIMKRDVCNERC